MSDQKSIKLHPSWLQHLNSEFEQPYFDTIRNQIQKDKTEGKIVFPPSSLIFKALDSTPLDKVKVVILGQDPYHNPNEAMGLSFSVPKGTKVPPSLQNIYKELASDVNLMPANHGDLSAWAAQGVLLLNTSLTVVAHTPMSHSKIGWQTFTNAIISLVSEQCPHVAFLLWGNPARLRTPLIDSSKHIILEAAHPSPLARGAFFGSKPFSQANAFLESHGIEPVNWNLNAEG